MVRSGLLRGNRTKGARRAKKEMQARHGHRSVVSRLPSTPKFYGAGHVGELDGAESESARHRRDRGTRPKTLEVHVDVEARLRLSRSKIQSI